MPVVIRNIFEEYCTEQFDVQDTIAVNNGTSALIAPLWSMDLQPGDEVITTPFTFIGTTNAILIAGGTPVFVDINEDDFLIDPTKIESAITDKTKAILPVHLFGQVCDMDSIMQIAKLNSLVVIEDTAQSFSAEYTSYTGETKMAGTIGDVGCFSFHKTKPMSTFEGGMITINQNSRLDGDKIRSITNQGQVGKYNHEYLGFNFRLAEPLCLLAYHNMKLHMKGVKSELGMRNWRHGHYPKVVYDQPIYKKMGIKGNCPIAEKVASKIKHPSEIKNDSI
tara:strand:+ start:150 stop:986 length:837 start_codon:yes stop_codon:yes gene_type:complete